MEIWPYEIEPIYFRLIRQCPNADLAERAALFELATTKVRAKKERAKARRKAKD